MSLPCAPCCVAIGNFDGVHRGHQAVLAAAAERAQARGLGLAVLTFEPHPAQVLRGKGPERLTSNETKLSLMKALHPELRVIVHPFTLETAALSPRQFAESVLVAEVGARMVLVGEGFRFGAKRSGDLETLRELGAELGFAAEAFPLAGDGVGPYSSSRVRELLREGNVEGAAEQLGRPHAVSGLVVPGAQMARQLGFPTANIARGVELLPGDGVYSAWVSGEAWGRREAVVHLGARPTFQREAGLEAHLLGETGDLYGQRLTVEFVGRLRAIQKFAGPEALAAQIRLDIAQARVQLKAP
jgi:riboflavin kinase / FMN adenylyltransferase